MEGTLRSAPFGNRKRQCRHLVGSVLSEWPHLKGLYSWIICSQYISEIEEPHGGFQIVSFERNLLGLIFERL